MIIHPIPPLFDADSRVLILGSFPSVKSREAGFFYGHPQNRFWKVTAALFGEPVPQSIPKKRAFLKRNHLAVWDVIRSCEITGSSDASIKNVTPNDLSVILNAADIRQIFVNGRTAEKYYRRYTEPLIGRPCVCLPSTSPANAACSIEKLTAAW
ncbi:MAG: DNA-deoxyinosine glycosylase [Lachnospiraceae bacterium]|nr:DNA-deoxyinosine glycosylase [Lachnospiraceae bacterium]